MQSQGAALVAVISCCSKILKRIFSLFQVKAYHSRYIYIQEETMPFKKSSRHNTVESNVIKLIFPRKKSVLSSRSKTGGIWRDGLKTALRKPEKRKNKR